MRRARPPATREREKKKKKKKKKNKAFIDVGNTNYTKGVTMPPQNQRLL